MKSSMISIIKSSVFKSSMALILSSFLLCNLAFAETQIGIASCLHGFVEATSKSGEVRILMPGDPIYQGDKIAPSGNGSSVCITRLDSNTIECIQ